MEITTYDKHLKKLFEEFPDIDEKSLRDVVRHGLAMIPMFRKNNHDIYLNNNKEGLYYYFGEVTNDEAKRFKISQAKIRKKLRLVYNLAKTKYSGYFYFSLTDEDYERHLKGEPIPKVYMYKIEEEAKQYKKATHLFRVAETDSKHWIIIKDNYETESAEYLQQWYDKRSESGNDSE